MSTAWADPALVPEDQFSQATEVGQSLSADSRHHAKNRKPRGQGDKGD
jgi:hypothetical protein